MRSTRALGRRRTTRIVVSTALACVAGWVVTPAAVVASAVSRSPDTAGLHVFRLNGRPFGVTTAIHVLVVDGSRYRVGIALAHHALAGGVQTPRAMCRATRGCVAAVNADYFAVSRPGQRDPGDEVGAIVRDCRLLHTPEFSHQQANLESHTLTQNFDWSDSIDVHGVTVPVTAINQELPVSYADVHLALSGTLLYTPPYALPPPSTPGRVTYEFALVGADSATRINARALLELVGTTRRPRRVLPGEVDVSAPPDSALSSLHLGQEVSTTTRSSAGCDSIGGHPILLDRGVAVPVAPADTYMAAPYARTVIGWTASGRTVLVAVDGRDGVSGATAPQLVRVLRALHVVTALDLDGGDSTTLYVDGRTLTHSSRGRERPVSTALVVVPTPPRWSRPSSRGVGP